MALRDILLTEENDVDDYIDDDLLTSLGEFVSLLDDDLFTEEIDDIIVDIIDRYIDLLEKLDIDSLSDEAVDHLEYILDILDIDMDDLDEAVKKKMIRKGKMIKRLPYKKGYKIKGNRYVRMRPAESKKRSMSAKRGARKARIKNASRQRAMKKSLKKRAGRGLK